MSTHYSNASPPQLADIDIDFLRWFSAKAAKHYVRAGRGVRDLDVWAFFASGPAQPIPYRRRGKVHFGACKFGRHPKDVGFDGRRVDVIGRDIAIKRGEAPATAIRRDLRTSPNKTPRLLRLRPIVLLTPPRSLGKVIWDPLVDEKGRRNGQYKDSPWLHQLRLKL